MSAHWIVIADASRARILSSDALFDDLQVVHELEYEPGRMRAADLKSDGPGSTRGGRLGDRAVLDPHTPIQDVEARRFAAEITGLLRANQTLYGRLVVVAPPRFLGLLRSLIRAQVPNRLVLDIGKDYTQVPVHALPEMLRHALPTETLT